MRIAVVAPPWYEIPPRGYGGIEALLAGLVDGLVAAGHEVGLVSAGRNGTRAASLTTLESARPEQLGDELTSLVHARLVEERLHDFAPDIVHDHTITGLREASRRPWPTITTVHGAVEGMYADLLRLHHHDVGLVALSQSQRRSAPQLRWSAVVRNGVDVGAHPFHRTASGPLLFLGRMHPDKGVLQAIEIAERAGVALDIASRVHGPIEERYFHTAVRPRLTSRIRFVGEALGADKNDRLSHAPALLFPLQWEEPYGMVVAEAQACGTPVLSLRRGAIPELVQHGRTGFLADHHLDLVPYVSRIGELSRGDCRGHALASLDVSATVRGYELVFSRALNRTRRILPPTARRALVTAERPTASAG